MLSASYARSTLYPGRRITSDGLCVNHHGQRKAKCVGSKAAADKVKKILEAKLSLGDSGVLTPRSEVLTFEAYADQWLVEYAAIACKQSTQDDY